MLDSSDCSKTVKKSIIFLKRNKYMYEISQRKICKIFHNIHKHKRCNSMFIIYYATKHSFITSILYYLFIRLQLLHKYFVQYIHVYNGKVLILFPEINSRMSAIKKVWIFRNNSYYSPTFGFCIQV